MHRLVIKSPSLNFPCATASKIGEQNLKLLHSSHENGAQFFGTFCISYFLQCYKRCNRYKFFVSLGQMNIYCANKELSK